MAAAVCGRITLNLVKQVPCAGSCISTCHGRLLTPSVVGIQFLLVRHGSFFNKRPMDSLWDSMTSVSAQGRKRGRASRGKLMKRENLYYGLKLGAGPSGMTIPGLNTPILDKDKRVTRLKESNQVNENFFTDNRERRKARPKFAGKFKTPPILRGYSGNTLNGRHIGAPHSTEEYNMQDFHTIILKTKKTGFVTKTQGSKFRFNVLVVTGNKQGLAGLGVGKSVSMMSAIHTARNSAAKHLQYFEAFEDRTLWHNFHEQYHRSKLTAFAKHEGHGIKANNAIKSICEVIGIKDIRVKVEGSTKNRLTISRAFMLGLTKQKTFQEMADEFGQYIVEMRRENSNHCTIKAAPQTEENKNFEKDVDFSFKTHFFGGKIPLHIKKKPFYANFPRNKQLDFFKYKNRNQQNARTERILCGLEDEPKFRR